MKNCPMCDRIEIEDWESLCKHCWLLAKTAYKRNFDDEAEIVERLKGQAKADLLDLLRELCRHCSKGCSPINVPERTCDNCIWKQKEKIVRAFLE